MANVEQSQSNVVDLICQLSSPDAVTDSIARSIAQGSDALTRIVAAADGLQKTAEENVSAHHYANVLFNILRGGIVSDQYRIPSRNFSGHIEFFNRKVHRQHRKLLESLPEKIAYGQLCTTIEQTGDLQLLRLSREFLPITFGRRHGDPSRPWNQFAIKLIDDQGQSPADLPGQLARYFPELGGVAAQLPGID